MAEYDLYELDFQDVYDITFDDVTQTPDSNDCGSVDSHVELTTQADMLPEPVDSVSYASETSKNEHVRKKWQTIELKRSKDYVLETIRAHGSGDLHVSRLIMSHFGVRHIEDEQYRQLLDDLAELAEEGHISRMADTPYIWCEPQDGELAPAPEILSEVERQRRAAEFARDLMTHARKTEQEGRVKSTILVRDYEHYLKVDNETAKLLLRVLEGAGLLFYAGDHKGTKQLTTSPELAIDKATRLRKKRVAKEKARAVLDIEDQEIVTAVLNTLAELKHVEQSMPIKKIWSDGYLAQLIDEKDFRRVIRVLATKGVISTEKQHGQFRACFATQAIRQQWKDEGSVIMNKLYEDVATEAPSE